MVRPDDVDRGSRPRAGGSSPGRRDDGGAWPRRGLGRALRATGALSLVGLVVGLVGLIGCRPPIACEVGQRPRKEVLCPPCATIEDPPPGYCPCTTGWVCRDTPARDKERQQDRLAARERSAAQRADAAEREEQAAAAVAAHVRLERENQRRRHEAAQHICDDEPWGGCPPGSWRKVAETGAIGKNGAPIVESSCVSLEIYTRTCLTSAEKEARERERERSRASAAEGMRRARELCAEPSPCRAEETRTVRFVCVEPEAKPLVRAEPTCEAIAAMGEGGGFGCRGAWALEIGCQKPPSPRPPCRAPEGKCCLDDGRIVRPCGPITYEGQVCDAHATCGSGGYCTPCR